MRKIIRVLKKVNGKNSSSINWLNKGNYSYLGI